MDAMTHGFLDNGAEVKVLTASTHKHPILMDTLGERYLHSTDLEAVAIETRLDVRDAYVAFMNGESYNISRFYAHHYAMVVKQALSKKRYDVVHLESLYTTPYIDIIRQYAPNALISLRSHNHEYQIWEQRWKASRNPLYRIILRHLSKTLERYEKEVLEKVDAVVSISNQEAQGYRDWGYSGPIHVAGFGIDTSTHAAGHELHEPPTSRPVRMFHLGAMDWGPNREGIEWFLTSVWPTLVARHPGTEFHLAGKGLDPTVYAHIPGVVNHGADAESFSTEFDLLVVHLLRGAGIRVKMWRPWPKGFLWPTGKGVAGLDLEDRQCIVHGPPEELGDLLDGILNQPEQLRTMAQRSRDIAMERFDRKRIGRELMLFYDAHAQL